MNDKVLKNLLDITSSQQMELLETEKLLLLTDAIIQDFTQDQTITSDDIISMHENWLSEIYIWAGQYRRVSSIPHSKTHDIRPACLQIKMKSLTHLPLCMSSLF